MDVIGYLRCSTKEQATDGYSLAAQRAAIRAEAERRGWTVSQWVEDPGVSGRRDSRPGLDYALALLENGGTSKTLVVSKLDRLGRSVAGMSDVLAHAEKHGWALVALDIGIDATTYTGRMVITMLAAVAQWESDRNRERTREGMAQARAVGRTPGRGRSTSQEVVGTILRSRILGLTLQQIADRLNDDGQTTATGKAWRTGTVHMVLKQEGVV